MTTSTNTIPLPTSWPQLDQALGSLGGLPLGRIVEISGTDRDANRTLALRLAAQAQRHELLVTYVDLEHELELTRAIDLGVRLDSMLVSQPDTAAQAVEIIDTMIRTTAIGLIIVDSISGFTSEPTGDGERDISGAIRIVSTALRRLASLMDHNTLVVFLSHTPVRKAMGPGAIPSPSSPAENGLRYYASVRLLVSRASSTANLATVRILKNKFSGNIFAEVELRGFCDHKAHVRAAVERFANAENFPNLDDAFIAAQAGVLGVEVNELRGLINERRSLETAKAMMLADMRGAAPRIIEEIAADTVAKVERSDTPFRAGIVDPIEIGKVEDLIIAHLRKGPATPHDIIEAILAKHIVLLSDNPGLAIHNELFKLITSGVIYHPHLWADPPRDVILALANNPDEQERRPIQALVSDSVRRVDLKVIADKPTKLDVNVIHDSIVITDDLAQPTARQIEIMRRWCDDLGIEGLKR